MGIVFTCTICYTRTAKTMSKQAYTHGVVIARCPKCQNMHLLADNLNYFGGGRRNIEDILEQKGQAITRVDDDTWELGADVVAGGQDRIQSP
ncbi:hypothetical protein PBRA_003911 [Plasmodiophora brassicae]|nr:hypothetical protein PBRA_003911 [Plasmodiophora brassicae]